MSGSGWRNPYYIYLINGLNNHGIIDKKLSCEEKQFAKIYCGQDQSFIFIPEGSKIDFEHLLVEAKNIDSSIRWKDESPRDSRNE